MLRLFSLVGIKLVLLIVFVAVISTVSYAQTAGEVYEADLKKAFENSSAEPSSSDDQGGEEEKKEEDEQAKQCTKTNVPLNPGDTKAINDYRWELAAVGILELPPQDLCIIKRICLADKNFPGCGEEGTTEENPKQEPFSLGNKCAEGDTSCEALEQALKEIEAESNPEKKSELEKQYEEQLAQSNQDDAAFEVGDRCAGAADPALCNALEGERDNKDGAPADFYAEECDADGKNCRAITREELAGEEEVPEQEKKDIFSYAKSVREAAKLEFQNFGKRKFESAARVDGLTVAEHIQGAVTRYNEKHGTDYGVKITSDTGPVGSRRHRHLTDGTKHNPCACAADFSIVDSNGHELPVTNSVYKEVAKDFVHNTRGSIGAGQEYMGGTRIHADLVTPEKLNGGEGTEWKSLGKSWSKELNAIRKAQQGKVGPVTYDGDAREKIVSTGRVHETLTQTTKDFSNTLEKLTDTSIPPRVKFPSTGKPQLDTVLQSAADLMNTGLSNGKTALPTDFTKNVGASLGNFVAKLSGFTPSSGSKNQSGNPPISTPKFSQFEQVLQKQNNEISSFASQQTQNKEELLSLLQSQRTQLLELSKSNPLGGSTQHLSQEIKLREQMIDQLGQNDQRDQLNSAITQMRSIQDEISESVNDNAEYTVSFNHSAINPASSNLTITALKANSTLTNEYRFVGSLHRELANAVTFADTGSYFGNNLTHEVLLDLQCDGTVDASKQFATPYYSVSARTDGAEVLLSEYMEVAEEGAHCFAFVADIDDDLSETDESDNQSAWRDFRTTDSTRTNSLPSLNFEVSVYTEGPNDSVNLIQDWTSSDVIISVGQEIAFRWDAPEYTECTPLLSALTAGALDNRSPVERNTFTEGIEIHERTGYYEVRCTTGSDTRVESVHVRVE